MWLEVMYTIAALWGVAVASFTEFNKGAQKVLTLLTWAVTLSLPIATPVSDSWLYVLVIAAVAPSVLMLLKPNFTGVGPITGGIVTMFALHNDIASLCIGAASTTIGLAVLLENKYNEASPLNVKTRQTNTFKGPFFDQPQVINRRKLI